MKFTLFLACLLLTFFTSINSVFAQAVGDYQSNGTGGGDWTANATWQTWNGAAWVAVGSTPSSTSGQITIQTGDSVFLNSDLSIDEVVVQTGGILTLFNGSSAVTYTLNDGAGDDIANSGKVYLAGSSVVMSGAGTVHNLTGGIFNLLFSPTLSVTTINDGEVDISNTVNISSATLTNNKFINWNGNSFNMSAGAVVLNNDSMLIQGASTTMAGSGTFTNANTGVIFLTSGATLQTTAGVAFSNNGILKGSGTVLFSNTVANTGTIEPGDHFTATAGTITANASFLSTGTPTYLIGIYSPGASVGVNYSQVASTTTVDVTAATLTLPNNTITTDPIGTTYNLVTGTAVTGPFATVNHIAGFGTLTYNATSIVATRSGTLPLNWGSFTVKAAGPQAVLNWTTLQESNTDAFIIERSADGVKFSPIGTIKAQGNSSKTTAYTFTDPSPYQQGYNYYRLQQTDLDGKSTYSTIQVIAFGPKSAVSVQTSPNPVKDLLNITVTADNVMISVTDMNGRNVKLMRLNRGFHQTGTSDLAPGAYQLTFYQGNQKIGSQKLLKL